MVMPAVTNPNDLYDSMVIKQLFKTEDGAWALYEKTWTKVAETGVSAIHLECPHWGEQDLSVMNNLQHAASWYLDEDNACWTCGCDVPEEIQTVYMLADLYFVGQVSSAALAAEVEEASVSKAIPI